MEGYGKGEKRKGKDMGRGSERMAERRNVRKMDSKGRVWENGGV